MYAHLSEILKNQKRAQLNSLSFDTDPASAAVLVLLFKENGEDHVVLTKRSEEVEHHKGQICFPGGVKDDTDSSLWHTALRETHEEIGLAPEHIKFLGELGPVITPTNFHVTPFVGMAKPPFEWHVNPREIAEIFSVPFSHLLSPQNIRFTKRQFNGLEYQDPLFTFGNHEIWGATGRILVELLEMWKSGQ